LGNWASVCVDIKELPHYSGYVRTIVFYRNNRVCIEFYPLVFDVHGAIIDYCCEFDSLKDAVDSIENFTGKLIEDWTNYNKKGEFPIYVDEQSSMNISQTSYKRLMKDACDRKVDLPQGSNFKLNWKIHFQSRKQYEKFLESLDELERELYKQATITYGTTA
jgi:hypothetical protein